MASLVQDRIAISSGAALLCGGLPVEQVIDLLTCGESFEDILARFGQLERDDILACIEFAYSK